MYVCVCVWFSLQSLAEAFSVGRGERDIIIIEHMPSFIVPTYIERFSLKLKFLYRFF